jgi:HAE1 family hydrophobic/amphiphilic exporter-1
MNIARAAVTRPVAVSMQIAALVLVGAICLLRLPVDLLPKVSLPTVSVSTSWPNVAPEEIEWQITRPLEQAVSAASNLYEVSSTSSEGSSSVRVQFQWGTDIGAASVEVLQLVERARRRFPNDPTLSTPIVFRFDPNQSPILVYGVSGEDDPVKLRTLLDNQIVPILSSANGVAAVVVTGGQERAILVEVDPVRLRAYHLGLDDVTRRIAQENLNLPAGIAKQGNTEYVIRSLGWLTSPEQIRRLPLGTYNGQMVRLGQVADVQDSHDEERIFTRFNEEPAVGLVVSKQSEANTVTTARAVAERIQRVQQLYPNLKFGLAYDQAQYIETAIEDVKINALMGGCLAVLILLFFLRNVRSTLVVALSIPISIISTFALLYLCDFTLNTMSLGGLALATGLIVDDAVVVLENIFRHMERDRKSSFDAAIDGTNEILSAVVASTWTVMVVFLPLLLIRGQAGQMFGQFALVVIFAMAVSLLVAATVVPMLAHRLISGEAHAESIKSTGGRRSLLQRAFTRFGLWFDALDRAYRNGLHWALGHRAWVVLGALAITGASLLLVPHIGSELMPATDSGTLNVNIRLPIGTALSTTNATMQQVERIVRTDPDVETVFAASGTSMRLTGTSSRLVPFEGSATVKLRDHREQSTLEVVGNLRRRFAALPGVRPRLTETDLVTMLMTGGSQNVEINIFGDDLGTLSQLARETMRRVRDIVAFENVDVNWEEAMPEIQWVVDREKANQLAVSFSDVANLVNTATNGSIASYYQEHGFQYPIIVQLPEATRKTVAAMAQMPLTANNPGGQGGSIVLSQVARPVYAIGPSEITRLDRQRYIAVTGTPQGRSAGEIQADIRKALADLQMPTGYYWDWGARQKRRAEEFGGLGLAVFLAIALIYMLLAAQFEAFLHPLTIMLSVPLAATGVILALFLSGRAFGLTAFIGALMLVGIVVKNGILLVDYTNQLRKRGLSRDEALLRAGPTRLRPILMTASAAMLGMLPIAIGLGKGSEVQAPMATTVIGGLMTSTFLTLFVVPVAYSAFDDLLRLISRRRGGSDGSSDTTAG